MQSKDHLATHMQEHSGSFGVFGTSKKGIFPSKLSVLVKVIRAERPKALLVKIIIITCSLYHLTFNTLLCLLDIYRFAIAFVFCILR